MTSDQWHEEKQAARDDIELEQRSHEKDHKTTLLTNSFLSLSLLETKG